MKSAGGLCRIILACSFVCLLTWAALWLLANSRTYQLFGDIIPLVPTTEKVVALTFDDGPSAKTPEVLEVLRRADIKGTFFVTGSELAQNMAAGRLIVAGGHELGNHTYSHRRMVLVSPAFVQQEIERTDELIRAAGYQGDIHFRPPNGKKLFVLPYYLSSHDRKTITWDIEPDSLPDTAGDAAKIVCHVTENIRPGSIILLHVMYGSRQESLKAVPGIVAALKAQGYSFKTVSELLGYRR